MRHWNIDIFSLGKFSSSCFYPTYEALKQKLETQNLLEAISFYPTYEALKHIILYWLVFLFFFVFTLPMRHWNVRLLMRRFRVMCKVFTLPMRHWNSLRLHWQCYVYLVFTLPMRHWNPDRGKENTHHVPVFTLPMRHWNYFDISVNNDPWCVFTLPMRHWNPRSICFSIYWLWAFLPYLWGIETAFEQRKPEKDAEVFTLPWTCYNPVYTKLVHMLN